MTYPSPILEKAYLAIELDRPGDLHELLTEADDDEKRHVFETFFNTSTDVRVTIASCAVFQQRDKAIDMLDVLVDHGYKVTDARRSHLLQAVNMNEEQQVTRPGHKLPDHISKAARRRKCEKHVDKLWNAAQKKRKREVKEAEKRQRNEVKRVEAQQKKEAKQAAGQQKEEDKLVVIQLKEEAK